MSQEPKPIVSIPVTSGPVIRASFLNVDGLPHGDIRLLERLAGFLRDGDRVVRSRLYSALVVGAEMRGDHDEAREWLRLQSEARLADNQIVKG